jgi:hypothetical protein
LPRPNEAAADGLHATPPAAGETQPGDQKFQKLWCEQAKPTPDHDPRIAGGNTARVYNFDAAKLTAPV